MAEKTKTVALRPEKVTADFSSLTAKQKKVYCAIETFIKSRGIPPTVREIGEIVGEKTPGAVQGILNRLEQKGVIKRELGMARSIQLVSNDSHFLNPLYMPEIKKVSTRNIKDLLNVYNVNKYHPFSPNIFESVDNCFMISCPDNSLFESGIKYDDHLIINQDQNVNDGDIVLVLYDNHVLLRYFHNCEQEDSIVLKADSNLIGKENFKRNEVTIVGRLVSKITKY